MKELEKKVEELPRDKQDQLALLDYVIGQLFDLRAKIQADQFARPRGSGYK